MLQLQDIATEVNRLAAGLPIGDMQAFPDHQPGHETLELAKSSAGRRRRIGGRLPTYRRRGLRSDGCRHPRPRPRVDLLGSGELRGGAVAPALQQFVPPVARASALISVLSIRGRSGAKVLPSAAMASLRPPRLRMAKGTRTVRVCGASLMLLSGSEKRLWRDRARDVPSRHPEAAGQSLARQRRCAPPAAGRCVPARRGNSSSQSGSRSATLAALKWTLMAG